MLRVDDLPILDSWVPSTTQSSSWTIFRVHFELLNSSTTHPSTLCSNKAVIYGAPCFHQSTTTARMCWAAVIFFPKCYCHLMQKAPSLCDDSYVPSGAFRGAVGGSEANFKYTFEPTLSVADPSAYRACGSVQVSPWPPNGQGEPDYLAVVHFNDDQRRRPYGLQCTKFNPGFRDAEDYETCPVHDWRPLGYLEREKYVRWQESLDLLWEPAHRIEIFGFRIIHGDIEYLVRLIVKHRHEHTERAPDQLNQTAYIKASAVDKDPDWLKVANAYHRRDEGKPEGNALRKKKWPLRGTQFWDSFIKRSRRTMSLEELKKFLFHEAIEDPSKNPAPKQSRKRKRSLTPEDPPLALENPPSMPENPPSTLEDRPLALEAHRPLPRQNSPSPLEEQRSTLEEQRSTLEEQLSLLQEHRPLPREKRTSLLENPPWTLDDLPSTSENQSMLLDFFLSEFEPQQKEKASQQDTQTEGTVPPV